ncbi:hypothetical protein AQUCO_01700655v1 [Aquilegia coerulea]|uniref:Uncharacterized protein n=1 Tax=Aquilegia coerulea TaxID=218851 RepID=A0A2G5DP21_AQUCA|nr:hypothetical protein AQUCO_01700655v1 [Aquilegia coerulea]
MREFPCTGKQIWPELVGVDGHEAAVRIERENNSVHAEVVMKGMEIVPMDFKCNRVWVWVDSNWKVAQVPRIG